jgi:hypothetical protein
VNETTIGGALDHRTEQSLLEVVELRARVAKAGEGDESTAAEAQDAAGREAEQVDVTGRDVLADVTGAYVEARGDELVMELALDQVHLPEVGLCRVDRHPRAMLDRRAAVGVTLHAEAGDEQHLVDGRLREVVSVAPVQMGDAPEHPLMMPDHLGDDTAKRRVRAARRVPSADAQPWFTRLIVHRSRRRVHCGR